MLSVKIVQMPVGGNKGFLCQIFCFKIVIDNLETDRKYQVLIAVYQIFIILFLVNIFPPPFLKFNADISVLISLAD